MRRYLLRRAANWNGNKGGFDMTGDKKERPVTRQNAFAVMDEALTMMDGALRAMAEQRREAGFGERYPNRVIRDFSEDEDAINELRKLSANAKAFLKHHLRNTMAGVVGYCICEKSDKAQEVALQLIDILDTFAPMPDYAAVKHAEENGAER